MVNKLSTIKPSYKARKTVLVRQLDDSLGVLPPTGPVHFIGIGGIGMSALARWFLKHNYAVSGSDSQASDLTNQLKNEGATIFIGHSPRYVHNNIEQVINTAAITVRAPGYKEYKQARRLHLPISSYAETLGRITQGYKTLAVAGAHGKSTTTALLSLVLVKAGLDPTVVIGTKLKEFGGGNFRAGKSVFCVIEADEHNAAFLNYHPFAAIITNIDREHLDFYKNLDGVKKSFLRFIENIEQGGIAVLNGDDRNLKSLKPQIEKISSSRNIHVYWYSVKNNRTSSKIRQTLQIPGDHNISNALAVHTLARALGIKEKIIFSSLHAYRGAWRRMEYRGKFRPTANRLTLDASVYDDYAHHPAEIKATLKGIAARWPKSPIICVFQPHQGERLKLLFSDFTAAFDAASALILLDLYKVAGRDSQQRQNLSRKLAHAIAKRISKIKKVKLKTILHLSDPKNLSTTIRHLIPANASPIIVMMGAGDIYKLTDMLVK